MAGTTSKRALEEGQLVRIGRGLYQDSRSDSDTDQTLAEVAKRVPKGVIAMISALAFHGLTDQMPRRVWVAIGPSDWSPVPAYPLTRIVRSTEKSLRHATEPHKIAGVDVPIYSAAKTIADLFRNGRMADSSTPLEGLRA